MVERKTSPWYCVSCSHILGDVVGGEFQGGADLAGNAFVTRGPNLVVTCPECGAQKVWYTADPITRALYNLVDATVSVAAKQAMREFGPYIRGLSKDIEAE